MGRVTKKDLRAALRALLRAVQPEVVSYLSIRCPACGACNVANKKLTEANFRHEGGCAYVAAREIAKAK